MSPDNNNNFGRKVIIAAEYFPFFCATQIAYGPVSNIADFRNDIF